MSANQQPHLEVAPAPVTHQHHQHNEQNYAQGSHALREVCPSCGGSGMLRLGDQRFRTCLDCLGQGHVPAVAAATTVAEVLQLDSRRVSAAASSAAAR
jgi:DnaJ-class molecular chaperone